ncbi:Protein CMSS1 [Bagarius yarrelli]|uniref:Protein CMSS1 n=1 Tax=Bagarius yarrelli TaxID=175774 RepID=A0A556VD45_BAGYA|nr:Protein CMSS1 [Bagarius yarrelli]
MAAAPRPSSWIWPRPAKLLDGRRPCSQALGWPPPVQPSSWMGRRAPAKLAAAPRPSSWMAAAPQPSESGAEDVHHAHGVQAAAEEPKEKVAKKRKLKIPAPDKVKKKTREQTESIDVKKKPQPEDQKEKKKLKKRRKKKTITDVLATSNPAPGSPSVLMSLLQSHFTGMRSVIEQEELQLPESCFLMSNDLTHSLSSYLKEICPKWAKVQKRHTQTRSVVLLIVCSSALRTIDLIKQLTTFKGEAKALKLFAKHIKPEDQIKLLNKSVAHIGVGTPGRLSTLIEKEGLSLQGLRYLVLDWNYRDQKQRRMVDIPEVKAEFLKLMESAIIKKCQVDYTEAGSCDKCFEIRKYSTNATTMCNCVVSFNISKMFLGDVFFYYGLINFHQNLRRYMDSRDDAQLVGRKNGLKAPSSYCKPFAYDTNDVPVAPCGAVANSMFNDSFTLRYNFFTGAEIEIPLLRKGITWYTDKNVKFRNPKMNTTLQQAFQGTTQPSYWQQPVYGLDPADPYNNGFINDDLIVWMREAAFPNFKKLYGILNRAHSFFSHGLPAGNYSILISYSILTPQCLGLGSYYFPVLYFHGRKEVVLTTLTWFGGKNPFLPIAYLVSGGVIFIMGIILTVVYVKVGRGGQIMEE